MINVNNPVSSGITTQLDVTGLRLVNNTVYQNTGSKPRYVVISLVITLGNSTLIKSDASADPSLLVGYLTATAQTAIVGFWVLPGYYYKVYCLAAAVQVWMEYQ